MWEPFTGAARRVIVSASKEAARDGSGDVIDTGHLLLGIIENPDSMAARVLNNLDVKSEAVREKLKAIPGVRQPETKKTGGGILHSVFDRMGIGGEKKKLDDQVFSLNFKKVIAYAFEDARSLMNKYIGAEHLLLGIMKMPEERGYMALSQLGIKYDDIRREVCKVQAACDSAIKDDHLQSSASQAADPQEPVAAGKIFGRWQVIALVNKERALNQQGDEKGALQCFKETMSINPSHVSSWKIKGEAYMSTGEHHKALKCYEQAVELDPLDAEAWVGKGLALERIGAPMKAAECFNRVLELG